MNRKLLGDKGRPALVAALLLVLLALLYLIISLRYGYVPFAANEQQPLDEYQIPLPPDARRLRVEREEPAVSRISFLTSETREDMIEFYKLALASRQGLREGDYDLGFLIAQEDGSRCTQGWMLTITILERALAATEVIIRKRPAGTCA